MEMWIGTYTEDILFGTGKILKGKGKGVYRLDIEFDTMEINSFDVNSGIINPSYLVLSPDGRYLFLVNELKAYDGMESGSVSSYAIDHKTRELSWISSQPTFGTDPCHLIINCACTDLFVANFMSGSISWYPISPEGSIGKATSTIQHVGKSVDPVRQKGPHAHAVVLSPDERFLFVPDLGLDAIVVYEVDYAARNLVYRENLTISSEPGSGPRQIIFHHKLPYAYIIHELDSTIYSYSFNNASGLLSHKATVSTLPDGYNGFSTCADIRISTCGNYLFGSNRGHDSLAVFKIDKTNGSLKCIDIISTTGNCPRNFTVFHDYVIVANQDSDTIVTFKLDKDSGKLSLHGNEIIIPTPVCVIL